MSQPGHRQLEHLPLGRIRQRVLSQFWLWFANPWDILTQKQAKCSYPVITTKVGPFTVFQRTIWHVRFYFLAYCIEIYTD